MKLNILLLTVMISYANAHCVRRDEFNDSPFGCENQMDITSCFNTWQYDKCKWTCEENEHISDGENPTCIPCDGGLINEEGDEIEDWDIGPTSPTSCTAGGGGGGAGCTRNCTAILASYNAAGCCGGGVEPCSTDATEYKACACCNN